MSLIGRYLIDDVIDKVLYTNVLTRIVENNFLVSADWLIPNQESTMSQGSFLSSDDYYFVDVNNVEIITEDLYSPAQ